MPSLKTLKGVPIFLALLLVATAARAERVKERYEKTFPFQPGTRFQVLNTNGAVTLEAWDRNEIQVTAEKWAESRSPKVAKKTLDRMRIDVRQTPGHFLVWTQMPDPGLMDWLQGKSASVGATYRIRVPRQAAIAAESSNGDITLAGTRGEAILENVNGAISVNAAQGKLSLITVNGNIKVRVPAGSRMTLDASAPNGTVRSDFKVAGAGPKKKKVLQGTVNGGGEKVFIRSVNGTIQISKL